MRAGNCLQPFVMRLGFVSTEDGLLVNAKDALRTVLEQELLYCDKKQAKEAEKVCKVTTDEALRLSPWAGHNYFDFWALQNRVVKYGDPNIRLRLLKIRIAAAAGRQKTNTIYENDSSS